MKYLIACMLMLISVCSIAQQSVGGTPISLSEEYQNSTNRLKSQRSGGQVFLTPVNNEKEQEYTDSLISKSRNKRNYYGKVLNTDIDILSDVKPVSINNGKLYMYHVISSEAYGIQFYFDRFFIPDGGKLFIYNGAKDMVLGAFTQINNNMDSLFATQYITGNSVYIEYFEPNDIQQNADLHINQVSHVFKPVFSGTQIKNAMVADCNIDIACEENKQVKNMAGSVALIMCKLPSEQYTYWCTGSLLNNTRNDGTPLFLSASHCCDTTRTSEGYGLEVFDYSQWLFLFNFKKESCGDQEAKTYNHSVLGAKLLSRDYLTSYKWYTDHLLLLLETTPEVLKTYNAVYAGWSANDEDAYNSSYVKSIHHPKGVEKKISSAGPVSSGNMNAWPDSQWKATWHSGVTDFGSSGAPLFNDQLLVIGLLHGGGSNCQNYGGSDFYSKFSLVYDYGNLDRWLDPDNKNERKSAIYDPDNINYDKSPLNVSYKFYNNEIEIKISESISTESNVFIRIYDFAGNQYHNETVKGANFITINVDLPNGFYILNMDYNFRTVSKKFGVFKD